MPEPDQILIRPLQPSDSLEELTAMLHRAYKRLADLGFNYTAVNQSVEKTRERITGCDCFVAVAEGKLIGTVTVKLGPEDEPPWAAGRTDCAHASQLAVDPPFRKTGLGRKLMDVAEDRARAAGFKFCVGNTSERADYLIAFYTGRGYEIVDHVQWPGKTYRSVVLAKKL
ncbi:MAG: GNAT family N-acetyltransferase [Planctomycetes bacterium]|nr:GNAT family N-acetyltransferase [Planctomycetota bacterium]